MTSGEDARSRALVLLSFPATVSLIWGDVPEAARPLYIASVLWIVLANIAGYAVPWRRFPRWTEMVPPQSTIVALWLMSACAGGTGRGYAVLILIPLLWLVLYADLHDIVTGFAIATACLLVPIDELVRVVPEQGTARQTGILMSVMFVISIGVRPIMRELRAQVRLTKRAVAALDASQATLVHDLRNPLAAVRSLATLAERRLERGAEDAPEKVAEYARVILASTERAERIIDGVLELSRSGELLPWAEPFDLRALVDEVKSGVTGVQVDASGAPAMVVGHRPSVARLLSNLFENAALHARPDRSADAPPVHVRVEGTENAAGWTIVVCDDGPGIEPAVADSLFEPWSRGAGTTGVGSGLGLAIVAGIVAQHGGTITASAAEGGGAAFRFTLSRRPPVAGATADPGVGADG